MSFLYSVCFTTHTHVYVSTNAQMECSDFRTDIKASIKNITHLTVLHITRALFKRYY